MKEVDITNLLREEREKMKYCVAWVSICWTTYDSVAPGIHGFIVKQNEIPSGHSSEQQKPW